MKQYIIQDWAGNTLNLNGRFQPHCSAVPMIFDSFDDGWEWIYTNVLDEESYQDLYVEELILEMEY